MRSRADLYDWELAHVAKRFDQDLEFYADAAAGRGGSVLELGCGTGRLTVALGAVGLDIDPVMLARARRHGARHLVRADMRRFALARRFDLVAIPYNTLQLLEHDPGLGPGQRGEPGHGMLACLRSAAAHLAPGGALALEVTDFQAGAVRTSVALEPLAQADGVRLLGALEHDLERRVTTYHRRFEEAGQARVDHVRLRCLGREELEALLDRAGLEATQVHEDPPRLLCVATPRQGGPADQAPTSWGRSRKWRRSRAAATTARARLD